MMNWTIPISDWTKTNPDSLKEIQRLGEQRLEETVQSINIGKQRAFTIMSILIPVVSILIGFALQNEKPNNLIAAVVAIPFIWAMWTLISVVIPHKQSVIGRHPIDAAQESFVFSDELDQKQQFIAMIIGEVEIIQQKIDFNEVIISKQTKDSTLILKVLTITFLLAAAAAVLAAVLP